VVEVEAGSGATARHSAFTLADSGNVKVSGPSLD